MTATWQSMRIYYYDANKDNLLLDCVHPLLAELQARRWIERAYFTRHWSGGSHLCLQMLVDPECFEQEVAHYVKREVETYLAFAPSTRVFTEDEARQQYERRGRMASYTSPVFEPLRPDNSVEFAPYDVASIAKNIGSEGAAHLLVDYYVETNDIAFSLIEQTRNNYTARLNACFDLLLAIAATSPYLPLRRAYMSYRSHAEAYIVCEPLIEEPRLRRKRLDAVYEQRYQAIRRRVIRTLRLIEKTPECLPSWLGAMIDIHRHYTELAYQGAQTGEIRLKTDEEVEEEEDKTLSLEESPFHTAARQNKTVMQAANTPLMIGHRIDLNFLYLQLNRIGMLNEDRYILDYYIANALEELLGIDPVAAISRSGASSASK